MADSPESRRPLDRALDALSAPDRRRLLHRLGRQNEPRALTLEATVPPGRDPDRYRIGMRHVHLPKLVDYGYVEFLAERELVRPGNRFEEIARVVTILFEGRNRLPGSFP